MSSLRRVPLAFPPSGLNPRIWMKSFSMLLVPYLAGRAGRNSTFGDVRTMVTLGR